MLAATARPRPLWPKGGSFNPTLAMVALAMDLVDKLVPKKQ